MQDMSQKLLKVLKVKASSRPANFELDLWLFALGYQTWRVYDYSAFFPVRPWL